jgi:hypothetical protein
MVYSSTLATGKLVPSSSCSCGIRLTPWQPCWDKVARTWLLGIADSVLNNVQVRCMIRWFILPSSRVARCGCRGAQGRGGGEPGPAPGQGPQGAAAAPPGAPQGEPPHQQPRASKAHPLALPVTPRAAAECRDAAGVLWCSLGAELDAGLCVQASGQAEVTGPRVVGDEREQRRRQKEEEQRQVRPAASPSDLRFPRDIQRCVTSRPPLSRGLSLMAG